MDLDFTRFLTVVDFTFDPDVNLEFVIFCFNLSLYDLQSGAYGFNPREFIIVTYFTYSLYSIIGIYV